MSATDRRPAGRPAALLCTLLCAVLALPAVAQQVASREQEQIRRLRQQVQQLQQELSTAQQGARAARAEADKSTSSAKAEASRVRRSAAANAERLKELEAEVATLRTEHIELQARQQTTTTELETTRATLAKAQGDLSERTQRLATRDGEFTALQTRFGSQNSALDLCSRHNQTLRSVSLDLLQRWQRMDWRDAVAAKEPFVQRERVRIENLVQGYEEQIDRASLAPTAAASQPAAAKAP